MKDTPTTLVFDALTNTETIRDLTAEEIAEIEQVREAFEARQIESQAKQAARESALAKLAALGLTEEEIAAL
jgi:hypothetical protein